MQARAPEEPGAATGVLLSVLLHIGLAAGIWAIAEARRDREPPPRILSVRLGTLPGGGGGSDSAKSRAKRPAPAAKKPVTAKPKPPVAKPAPKKAKPVPKKTPAPPEPKAPAKRTAVKPPTEDPKTSVKPKATPAGAAKPAPNPASPSPAPSSSAAATDAASAQTGSTPAVAGQGPGSGPGTGGGPGGPGAGPGSGIKLDSDFPYAWYLEIIQRRVSQGWLKPAAAAGLENGTVIYFRVLRDGKLGLVEVERASGLSMFDRSALRAVYSVGQLPPLPAGFQESYLGVHFEFLP